MLEVCTVPDQPAACCAAPGGEEQQPELPPRGSGPEMVAGRLASGHSPKGRLLVEFDVPAVGELFHGVLMLSPPNCDGCGAEMVAPCKAYGRREENHDLCAACYRPPAGHTHWDAATAEREHARWAAANLGRPSPPPGAAGFVSSSSSEEGFLLARRHADPPREEQAAGLLAAGTAAHMALHLQRCISGHYQGGLPSTQVLDWAHSGP